jgi:hypothetical protein
MSEIRKFIDPDNFKSKSVSTPYPHIKIVELNIATKLVVDSLDEGDMPLLATYKGETKIIKSISNSAININRLLKVNDLDVVFSKDNIYNIQNILDYMEASKEWI